MNHPNSPSRLRPTRGGAAPGLALALLTAVGVAASVPARANIIINGSFETPTVGPPGYVYNPAGYSFTFDPQGNAGVVRPPSGFGTTTPADGAQYAFIQSASNLQGYFTQAVSLTAGTAYNYSFAVAGRQAGGSYDGNTSDTFGFLTSGVFSPITTFTTTSGSGFTTVSGSFVAPTLTTYNIGFINTSSATGDHTAFIDNFDLSAAPEPAQVFTLGFFGMGLLGLALRARKRGNSPAV